MRVAIRADASSRIGLGHIARCMALAHALRDVGAQVLFLTRPSDAEVPARLRVAGFEVALLDLPRVHEPGRLTDAALDAEACLRIMDAGGSSTSPSATWPSGTSGTSPVCVIVDHYGLDADWHQRMRDGLDCCIVAIDDLADRPLDVDVLVDHNLLPAGTHQDRYLAQLRRAPRRWFCGPRYALLGPAYAGRPDFSVAPDVRSVGIFMGGTDPQSLSATLLHACRQARFNGPVEIVSTTAAPTLAELKQVVAKDGQAVLSINLPHLADFYARHDLQIGAGGGASWERCAVGCPSLTLCVADNQRAVIPALVALGVTASTPDLEPESLVLALKTLLDDPKLRRSQSLQARKLVDGLGARRVALGLLALTHPASLRAATLDDARTIWAWRNHPATRAVSRQAAEIPFESHLRWLEGLLDKQQSRLMIARYGDVEFGVIRFDPLPDSAAEHESWEVSLYLAPDFHGLGLGSRLLAGGEQRLLEEHVFRPPATGPTVVDIHAEVLEGNQNSEALFRTANYQAAGPGQWLKRVALH